MSGAGRGLWLADMATCSSEAHQLAAGSGRRLSQSGVPGVS
ncbi:hypothetical protein [Xanthomonas arboricola]|nr:hypothetical protein [Xanthomonas arboricola]SOU12173.1 hypothetical protein LMG19145_03303 [Xanthomonas arboricola pv. fragariae]